MRSLTNLGYTAVGCFPLLTLFVLGLGPPEERYMPTFCPECMCFYLWNYGALGFDSSSTRWSFYALLASEQAIASSVHYPLSPGNRPGVSLSQRLSALPLLRGTTVSSTTYCWGKIAKYVSFLCVPYSRSYSIWSPVIVGVRNVVQQYAHTNSWPFATRYW